MTDAALAVFLLVGLLGGAHCLGMCGPLVTLYAERLDRGGPVGWHELGGHALFNAGRTAGYAAAGALLGGAGALAFEAAAVLAVADLLRGVAGLIVGAFVLVTGAGYLLGGRAPAGHDLPVLGNAFGRVHGAIVDRVDRWARPPRIAALGALHALLPCPLLYPAYLYALARGSPTRGALLLGALGVGTFPALFAYGTVVGSASARNRSRLHRALGVAFLALAYLPLSMGLAALGVAVPTAPVPYYQPL